jgi:hypothetical protein
VVLLMTIVALLAALGPARRVTKTASGTVGNPADWQRSAGRPDGRTLADNLHQSFAGEAFCMPVESLLPLSTQPLRTSVQFSGCLILSATALMMACASAGTPVDTRPIADLQRQSAAIEPELATLNEHELRVRVVNVTTRLLKSPAPIEADEAATIEAEVKAINTQLSSLKIQLLAPALRFRPRSGSAHLVRRSSPHPPRC